MKPVKVGICGLGTVGGGTFNVLKRNAEEIARRAGRGIEVAQIAARDTNPKCDTSGTPITADVFDLVNNPEIDIIIELIGGYTIARDLVMKAIENGKHVVTANKALIAVHGNEIFAKAREKGVIVAFEAAVAGGIPVIKAIREGASANEIARVYGILNGTCNYILTLMEREGAGFADALAAAQAEGYAEADPTFDVDGIDAAHKLSILAALCFGTRLDIGAVTTNGIRNIIAADIREAEALGHRVRLIGMAERDEAGLSQHVQPCLVPADHPLAYVPGALNAVVAEGNFVGRLFFEGAGAGAGPTASAIVADIIDIARDEYGPAFAMPVDALDQAPVADAGARVGKHYVRLIVEDRIGVLAEIATAMRDAGVSIESFIQRGNGTEGGVVIALVTHDGPARAIHKALAILAASDHVIGTPMHMPILAL